MKVRYLLFLLFTQCAWEPKLAAFNTDGCSLSPERSVLKGYNWRVCCTEHDLAYWKGGSAEERLAADKKLRDCILEKTGNPRLARIYFEGVQLGGEAYFPTWYRWGYGWNYLRQPAPLTDEENAMVENRLKEVVIVDGSCLSCKKMEANLKPPHRR
ncbi:hypothetical protein [Haloferula sp.]|uniref:hypothetical protein n=1 Tax=Haloferula sp. TaxID=2497595 RepID=UPI00329E9747